MAINLRQNLYFLVQRNHGSGNDRSMSDFFQRFGLPQKLRLKSIAKVLAILMRSKWKKPPPGYRAFYYPDEEIAHQVAQEKLKAIPRGWFI